MVLTNTTYYSFAPLRFRRHLSSHKPGLFVGLPHPRLLLSVACHVGFRGHGFPPANTRGSFVSHPGDGFGLGCCHLVFGLTIYEFGRYEFTCKEFLLSSGLLSVLLVSSVLSASDFWIPPLRKTPFQAHIRSCRALSICYGILLPHVSFVLFKLPAGMNMSNVLAGRGYRRTT
jgi:hypothetical protein